MPNWITIKDTENSRTYVWPNGMTLTIKNVHKIAISEKGTHRIETASGDKHIIMPGWLYINLDAREWTF